MKKHSNKYLLISLGLLLSLAVVASLRQEVVSNSGTEFTQALAEPSVATETSPEFFSQPNSLRIATYNIARGKGTDGIRDINRTASALRNFDIIGLNEVGGFPLTNNAEQIANELGMAWLFAPNQKRWFYDYFGNAMLGNLQVTGWQSVMLPRDIKKNRAYRNYVLTRFKWQGKELVVIATHLGRGELVGVQLNQVMEEFVKHPHAILMGDFNLRPDDPHWNEQVDRNQFIEADSSLSATNQLMAHHNERVDYIFLQGMKVLDSGHYSRGVSDHPLVWAEVMFSTDEGSR